jgi:hypothetical protein
LKSALSPLAGFGESLSDAIPGFTDEVVMLATLPESFSVVRWRPAVRQHDPSAIPAYMACIPAYMIATVASGST